MNKDLGHPTTAHVHVLDLLRCDVLPLSQLEDVLLPVNYLQNATLLMKSNKRVHLSPRIAVNSQLSILISPIKLLV